MTMLLVGVGGALGAVARYVVAVRVQRRVEPDRPLGTAVVNLIGAFALGLTVGSGLSGNPLVAVAAAVAGFTTYSTWMVEIAALIEEGREGLVRGVIDLVGMMAAGLVLAWIGLEIGRAVF